MAESHTPGPWEVVPHHQVPYLASGIQTSYNVQAYYRTGRPRGKPERRAVVCGLAMMSIDNARLIAAAPDLLHACKLALNWIPATSLPGEVLAAAVARAEGGTEAR